MATFTDEVRVQVLIRRDTPQGRFQDAIYLSVAEFEALKDEEIEALKDARVAGWMAAVDAAKTAPRYEPTKAELEAEKASLEAQVAEVNAKLAAAEAEEVKEPVQGVK